MQTDRSRVSCHTQLSCPGCSVMAVLPHTSHPGRTSQLSCPCCSLSQIADVSPLNKVMCQVLAVRSVKSLILLHQINSCVRSQVWLRCGSTWRLGVTGRENFACPMLPSQTIPRHFLLCYRYSVCCYEPVAGCVEYSWPCL